MRHVMIAAAASWSRTRVQHLLVPSLLAFMLGWPDADASAQRLASSGLQASHANNSAIVGASRAPASAVLNVTPSPRLGDEMAAATGSRAVHTGRGAIIGAVLGGVFGFVANQQDHTGEGLIAPVMIGGGAALGAVAGALVGLVWPIHR